MALTLTMPKLSPTMNSGTIAKWHKKVGDRVEIGDVLMEVATDKATVEYEAIDGGWLRQIVIKEGEEAVVNQPIALLTETAEESFQPINAEAKKVEEAPIKEEQTQETKAPVSRPQGAAWQQPAFVPEAPLENYHFEYPREAADQRLVASPLAKKLAKEKGLDLSTVKGTGPGQRIVSKDLEKAQHASELSLSSQEVPMISPGTYEEQALTPMRKVIGQRLQESKSFIPHFYVRQEIDASALMQMREQLKEGQVKVSVNDFVVRACALALKKHPQINCGFNSVNQTIIQFKTVDIAIAVSVEGGLITPIVRHADFKNLGELSAEIKHLALKARDGKLEPHEYKGGSFTISNLGMYGITDFLAIINPPQAAILGVSGIQEVPIVKNGLIVPGQRMNLSLSVDHRVIDGVAAAVFLKTIKKYLENPALLMLV